MTWKQNRRTPHETQKIALLLSSSIIIKNSLRYDAVRSEHYVVFRRK